MKKCSCGIILNEDNVKFVGIQETPKNLNYELVLFDCPQCGTTKAIRIEKRK